MMLTFRSWAWLAVLVALVSLSETCSAAATATSKSPLSPAEVAAVIKSRQYQPAYKQRRASPGAAPGKRDKLKRQNGECPAAPLPTLGCQGCTTCRDEPTTYCAAPNADPLACGTCNSDRITCPTPGGTGQLASCTAGECGAECDTANGYFGPSDSCSSATVLSHVTCPEINPQYGVALTSGQFSAGLNNGVPIGTPFFQCVYGVPTNYPQTAFSCRYNPTTGSLIVQTVNPSYTGACPATLPTSPTSGFGCYNHLACQPTVSNGGGATQTLSGVASVHEYDGSGSQTSNALQCVWRSNAATVFQTVCVYNSNTETATYGVFSVNGVVQQEFTAESCPALRTEYSSYCLGPPPFT